MLIWHTVQSYQVLNAFILQGAQAIAAMAYGTESIQKVDKIFGPGNQYVTKAKTIIQSESQTAIDMPAGPSEVLIIADDSANPEYVAADLLAQAEHGIDSQAILVSDSKRIIDETSAELKTISSTSTGRDCRKSTRELLCHSMF